MDKKILFFYLAVLISLNGVCGDTLYKNVNYPPLVYSSAELKFYRYTAKYIPDNLFHAFKILGTEEKNIIERFKNRSVEGVMYQGMYYPSARLRKEFCLEGYSRFVLYFHQNGIFYPKAMVSYILLTFHQYLNGEKIDWVSNKKIALAGEKKWNRIWKKRRRRLFQHNKVNVKESKKKTKKENKPQQTPDELFWGEFGEK